MPYDESGVWSDSGIYPEYSDYQSAAQPASWGIDYTPLALQGNATIDTSAGTMTVNEALAYLRARGVTDTPGDLYTLATWVDQQAAQAQQFRPPVVTPAVTAAPAGQGTTTVAPTWQNDLYQLSDPASRTVAQQLGWNPDALTWAQKEEVYRRATGSTPAPAPAGSPAFQNTYVAPATTTPPAAGSTEAQWKEWLDTYGQWVNLQGEQFKEGIRQFNVTEQYNRWHSALIEAGADRRLADQLAAQKAIADMQFKINEGTLTGQYNGAPTLAAQNQAQQLALQQGQLTGTYNGAPTLAAQAQQQQTALALLNQASQLKGPADWGAYNRMLYGANESGLSRAVDAITGKFRVPSVQAPQGPTQPASLSSLAAGFQAPGAGLAEVQQTAAALPALNKIDSREWLKLNPTTQQLFTGLYASERGYDPTDVQEAVKRNLPGFTVPALAGRVA